MSVLDFYELIYFLNLRCIVYIYRFLLFNRDKRYFIIGRWPLAYDFFLRITAKPLYRIVASFNDFPGNFFDIFPLLIFNNFSFDRYFFDYFPILVLEDFLFVWHVVDSTISLINVSIPLTTYPSLNLALTILPTALVVSGWLLDEDEKLLSGLGDRGGDSYLCISVVIEYKYYFRDNTRF